MAMTSLMAGQWEQYASGARTAMAMVLLNPLNCLSAGSYKPWRRKAFSGKVAYGKVYVVSNDAHVYAFGLPGR